MISPAGTITPTPMSPKSARQPMKRRRHLWLRIVALVMVILMIAPGISYAQALTAPGYASWPDRSVGWVRDNGGAPLVNAIENWWYTRHAPANAAPDAATLPHHETLQRVNSSTPPRLGVPPTVNVPGASTPQAVPPLAGAAPLPGEGIWTAAVTGRTGAPVLFSTFLRPDPSHASVVAGAAWVPSGATTAHLVPGTRQPHGWGGAAAIPASDLPSLVATFNSGWKFSDTDGGFYLNGRQSPALQNGRASVAIDKQGRITVGQWGRDVSMGPDVVAVRQNLHLIVDSGTPLAGLDVNGGGLWGSAHNQLQFTWRSGLGTDAAGNLIYVAGNGLTLQTLATAMSEAGVQRGMQLDIHAKMVNFAVWSHPAGAAPSATNLLPDMAASPTRYVNADQRDFFYLTLN